MTYKIRTYDDLRNGRQGVNILSDSYDIFSIPVPGDGMFNYSATIAEATLWMTSNFSAPTPTYHPITGQLWWDTASKALKIFNGSWDIVQSNVIDPNSIAGDLLPKEDGFNIGSGTHRYKNLYVNSIYTSALSINNGTQNITIGADGTVSIATISSGYTDSSGISATMAQSIEKLKTKYNSPVDSSSKYVDLGVLTGNNITAHENTTYYVTYDPIWDTQTASYKPLVITPSSYNIEFSIVVTSNTFIGDIVITQTPTHNQFPFIKYNTDKPTNLFSPPRTEYIVAIETINHRVNIVHEYIDNPPNKNAKCKATISVFATGVDGEFDVIITGGQI